MLKVILILFIAFANIFIMTNQLSSKVIAVVGGGNVGAALASRLVLSGLAKDVMIGARDPTKTKSKLIEQGHDNIKVEAIESAISSCDVLILATTSFNSDEGIEALAKSLGNVDGKCIIDATVPITDFQDGYQIRWKQGTSGGEKLQEYLPNTKVYKAFNTLGVEHMIDPVGKDMMFCGPDADIADVVAAVGYKPYYVGPIRYARNLEAIAELWIHCAIPGLPANYIGHDWTFAINGNPESS